MYCAVRCKSSFPLTVTAYCGQFVCRGLVAELGLCLCLARFVEKGNLEILLFSIQSQMRANNQKPYMPNEGRMISDINRAWEELERAEHERELALRDELVRCVELFSNSFRLCYIH